MGTRISVFSNSPNVFVYAARKCNSYVQLELDLVALKPTLHLRWYENQWRPKRPKNNIATCQILLYKIVKKIQKTYGLSPALNIMKTIPNQDKYIYLKSGFHVVDSGEHWCNVGISLRKVVYMNTL